MTLWYGGVVTSGGEEVVILWNGGVVEVKLMSSEGWVDRRGAEEVCGRSSSKFLMVSQIGFDNFLGNTESLKPVDLRSGDDT